MTNDDSHELTLIVPTYLNSSKNTSFTVFFNVIKRYTEFEHLTFFVSIDEGCAELFQDTLAKGKKRM